MTLVVRLPRSPSAATSLLIKAAAFLLLMKTEAVAQAERLVLTWNAPPGCPTESEVTSAALRGGAARASDNASGPDLIARAKVSQRNDGIAQATWHVLLRTQRGSVHGQREIEAESCAGLAQATAVVLSLALLDLEEDSPVEFDSQTHRSADFDDAETQAKQKPAFRSDFARSEARPPAKDDMGDTTDEQDIAAAARPATLANTRSLVRFSVGAQAGFNVGTLPRVAPGGALSLAWLPGAFRLEFHAQMWGRQSQSISDTSSGARLFLSSLGVRACIRALRTPRLDLSPCIGSEFHLLSAQGFGSDTNYDTRAHWPALTGGLLGRARLSERFFIRVQVEGQAPLARPRLFVEHLDTVHRIPSWAATSLFGVEVRFP